MSDYVSYRLESFTEPQRMAYLLRLVAINAYAAYMNTLVGNPAPAVEKQGKRTQDPQVGDVVLETSTVWRVSRHVEDTPGEFHGLGVLLRRVREPCPRAEDEEDDGATEEVFYIRPLDGSVPECRWTNASFIRVLVSLDDCR